MSRIYFYNTNVEGGTTPNIPFDKSWKVTDQAYRTAGQIEGTLEGTPFLREVNVTAKRTLVQQFFLNNIKNGTVFSGHVTGQVRARKVKGDGVVHPVLVVRVVNEHGKTVRRLFDGIGTALPHVDYLTSRNLPLKAAVSSYTVPAHGKYSLVFEYGFATEHGHDHDEDHDGVITPAVADFEFGNADKVPHEYDLPEGQEGYSTPGSQWVEFDFNVSYND
jgi:hypothetical protein